MKKHLVEEQRREKIDLGVNGESRTITILVLGETGVGKSTWINGFVNYVSYDSLEEAERGAPVSVIPARFTVRDSDFNKHSIVYNIDNDSNESTGIIGQSVTQMPKSYLFIMRNAKVRIIDTPGMGDTRGIERDRENMENTLNHLSQYEEIDGIVILLKPNNARVNVMFVYCIKELLSYLHKDARQNILFCFTNARGTFYRPGDTLPALKNILSSNRSIDIKLNKDTVYCMDNEAVRFLMATRTIKFDESERQELAVSWRKSADESVRMINYLAHLRPHPIQKTLSINKVRRSMIEQSRAMAEIARAIQMNINAIKDKQVEEISVNRSKQELLNQLKVPSVSLKITNLDHARTVCTSPQCVSLVSSGGDGKCLTHYKTICHDRCCDVTTDKNVIRCVALQKCSAMDPSTGKCRVCSCSWDTHMHITYDAVRETRFVEDESIKRLINQKEESIKAIREHLKQLNDKLTQLNYEKKKIAMVYAYFAYFLKHNSIAPYNDALLDYLNYLIEDEKMKNKVGISPRTLEGLMNIRNVYQEEIRAIEEAIERGTSTTEITIVDQLMTELKQLPNVGAMMKDAMAGARTRIERATRLSEEVIVLPRK